MVSRFYPFSASGFVKQGANKLMLDVHVLHELSIYILVSKQEFGASKPPSQQRFQELRTKSVNVAPSSVKMMLKTTNSRIQMKDSPIGSPARINVVS